jgi:Zn-dependent alcohol dehydrogenase
LLNTSRLVGGALGLAILSTIAAGHTRAAAAHGASSPAALTGGFGLAFAVGAGFCLVGALAAVGLLAPRRAPARELGLVRQAEIEALEAIEAVAGHDAEAVDEPLVV